MMQTSMDMEKVQLSLNAIKQKDDHISDRGEEEDEDEDREDSFGIRERNTEHDEDSDLPIDSSSTDSINTSLTDSNDGDTGSKKSPTKIPTESSWIQSSMQHKQDKSSLKLRVSTKLSP